MSGRGYDGAAEGSVRGDLIWWPTFNACLNATSTMLLCCGWLLIQRGRRRMHTACMAGALAVSVLFVVSYLMYHYRVGATTFPGTGGARVLYFSILISHTCLAVTVPPLAVWTLVRALRGRWEGHARLGRGTLPIWLYVNVTGVLVYLMLYHFFPGGAS